MRILQLIDTLKSGGAERMCINIANVLYENGHYVTICTTREGGTLEKLISPDINYHSLNKKHSADFIAFLKLVRLIREENIEIVHAHSSSLFWAVGAKMHKKSIKVIWHDHLGLDPGSRRQKFLYEFVSYKIDAIITVNKELEDWSHRNMKVTSDRIVLMNNFPLLKTITRQSDPDYFRIVHLANLRPQKDHMTLVKAIALLKNQNPDLKLRVIFAGSYFEDEYFLRIKKLIVDLELTEIIEIPGSVEEVALLLAGADCGVLSSVSEGLPVSLLEYGLSGLPVVVTDVGQCAEVIGYGKFGKVVPPGRSDLFAGALKELITNKEESIKLGMVFKEHVLQNYGPENFFNKYMPLIKAF